MVSNEHTAPTRTGVAARASPAPQLVQIGRYKVLGLLGRGGMGDVYLGVDEQLERQVAIKLLARREGLADGSDRLQREALALARLAHPNVVAIHEVGESGDQVYLVMERIDGVTLRAWLAEGKHSRAQILEVMLQAGRGLAAAHAAGLVHRDFKPENVMVGVDGRVRVMDFGLACAVDEPELSLTTSSNRLVLREGTTTAGFGTPGYMAPEQILGAPQDARSDIFSFCVVLFEVLHGRRPFLDMRPLAMREAVLRGQIVAVPDKLPCWLDSAIRRGLSGDRTQRWATIDELLGALTRAPLARRRFTLRALGLLTLTGSLVLAPILGIGAVQQAAREQAEQRAGERLLAAQALIDSATARGDAEIAAATFTSFVADPAHRGTRALSRAWRLQGDQSRLAGARDDALRAYARAYLESADPGETTTLLRTMAGMFRAHWDGPALAQALATLQARGLTVPADAALMLDAALLQGDLPGASAAAGRDDRPGAQAWSALFTTLAQARDTGLAGARVLPLPASGPAAFVTLDATERELLLLDPDLAIVGRFPAAGRRLDLVEGAGWVFASADGQGELLDLAAPRVPLWRGKAGPIYLARALDLDGDGAQELLFGRSWPQLGFRALTGLGGPTPREQVAHATTDANRSALSALWVDDLDGDGTREIAVAVGPWHAFDLRIFHADAHGGLELVARRSFGNITALTTMRRGGERLLAAVNDEHCPDPERFPRAPHTGAPAGVHLLRWDGAALIDADFLPLPRSDGGPSLTTGRLLLAADLDGDAADELIVPLVRGAAGITMLVRQDPRGLDARLLHGLRPLVAAQFDSDPAHELLVHADHDGKSWILGAGDTTLPPLQPPRLTHRERPATLGDPLLVDRWARADELADLGLLAPAAASLGEIAGFTADPQARRELLGQAATLLARAGDDAGVIALVSRSAGDPGPEALAHRAAALAHLGRHDEAHAAAVLLAAHPERSAAQAAEAEQLRARLAPLVAPGARLDLDLGAPFSDAWRFLRPASLRADPSRPALELTIPGAPGPVAELPIDWDGGPIALEVELDLQRLESGACLRFGLLDHNDDLWLGAGVCGIGGGGRLMFSDRCKLGGVGWTEFSEEPMTSAVLARKLVLRLAAFPDGTHQCSIDDGVRRRSTTSAGATLPLPGPQRLALGGFVDSDAPALATGSLRRVTIHGARARPAAGEPTPQAVAARRLVEGEPAAALAALDEARVTEPRDALLRMSAYDDLRDQDGLTRTTPELLPHLNDPAWRAELTVLLRTRPAAAMALLHAAKGRLLPTLARAWEVMRTLVHDPGIQRSALAELGGIDLLRPVDPAERQALRVLLALRGHVREQLGHREQARHDFEAALAVPATGLGPDLEVCVDTHMRLARLLVASDPPAARAHAAAAAAASPTPELIDDRLATIPGLR